MPSPPFCGKNVDPLPLNLGGRNYVICECKMNVINEGLANAADASFPVPPILPWYNNYFNESLRFSVSLVLFTYPS